MNALITNINKIVGENPPFLEDVLKQFKKVNLNRNDFILKEGEICKAIYFVESGIIQVFQLDQDGGEKTTDLIINGDWFTDLDSFKNKVASKYYAKAKKATSIYKVSFDAFTNLMIQVPKFAEAYFFIIEQKYTDSTKRIAAFNAFNAQEKIHWLYKFRPDFIDNVSDKLIASYLGISKETYCRLK